jgi:malonyl-CoA O-methyltransferase
MASGFVRNGVFVTGTDTGVGKTIVAACLVRRWNADYWKPAQTGLADEPGDSETITHLTGLPPARIHPPRHAFAASLSVEAAAAAEGARVALDDFDLPHTSEPLVVEGAGGVLAPLCAGALTADLMARLALPIILVARTTLGTINHTLLSLEALRARNLQLLGVVLAGVASAGNRDAIVRHGGVPIMAELPRLEPPAPNTIAAAAAVFPDWKSVRSRSFLKKRTKKPLLV